jgi:TP901 family phage tail tape measure protein
MAKKISDEVIKLSIIINGNEAQKEILDLEKAQIKLKGTVKELIAEEKKLQAEYNRTKTTYDNSKKQLDETTAAYNSINQAHSKELARLKDIEAQEGKNSTAYRNQVRVVRELEAEGKKLWNTQDRLSTTWLANGEKLKQIEPKYSAITKEIKETNAAIDANEAKLKELNGALKLTEMTTDQLRRKADLLKATLRHLVPGTADHKQYTADLKEVEDRLVELNSKGKAAKWSVGGLADAFNRYAALAASAVAALTGVILSIQKVIDYNGKLSDKMADVSKTTGMTKREVDELTKSFGLLHTRTSRVDLLGIAEVGGKLGIAKNEIGDFVRVMNKAGVALSDAFQGGPEVVADKLGKIKGLYDELRNTGVEHAFESVGSALNDLGADGTASEANVAEFVQRVGAIPGQMKPAIHEALGLGAAFEESGLMAEVAGNNYGKFISIASRDIEAFARSMRRPKAELEALINTNPTEFFLQFAQSLKGIKNTELSTIFDHLKLNDNEVKEILGAASQNVQLFRDKIELAKVSMADATSLTTEYDIKNKTLGATLDRLKKVVTGWFSSDSVVTFLDSAVTWLAKFVGAIEDSENTTQGWRNTLVFTAKVIGIVATGLISYTTSVKLAALWTNNMTGALTLSNIAFRIGYARLVLQEVATKALALAKALLTFNIGKVRVAYQALSLAMGMSPFGALLAVVGAVTAAFIAFRKSGTETEGTIKRINNVLETNVQYQKLLSQATNDLKNKIDPLVKALKSEETSLETRKRAYESLIKIAPEFEGTVDKEYKATAKLVEVYEKLLKQLEAVSMAKARAATRDKLSQAVADAESKEYDAYLKKLEEDTKNIQIEAANRAKAKAAVNGGGGTAGGLGGTTYATMAAQSNVAENDYKKAMANSNIARQNMENYTDYLQKIVNQLEQRLKKVKVGSEEAAKIRAEIDSILGFQTTLSVNETGRAVDPGDGKGDKAAERAAAKERKFRLDAINKAREDAIKAAQDATDLERKVIDERLALMMEGFDKEAAIEAENHKRKLQDLQKQLVSEVELAKLEEVINEDTLSPKQRGAMVHIREAWLEKNKHINSLLESEQGRHELAIAAIQEKSETKRIQDSADKFARETEEREAAHLLELAALGNNEAAKEKLQRKFDKEELDRQTQFLKKLIEEKQAILSDKNNQIDLSLLTPDQVKDLEAQIAKLKKELAELLQTKNELAGQNSFKSAAKNVFGGADVLGFSADQWGSVFANLDTVQNKLQATVMVVQALQNLWGAYNDYLAANENASLRKYEKGQDSRKKKLKWQLDNGYISQTQYKREIENLDAELDKKKAEIEYRQAKRAKAMAVAQIATNTAQAIMGIWAQFPKADFGIAATIASAAVGALGALQLATVLKTPLPAKGYEKGLYPEYVKREQDGKIFRAGYGGKTRSGMVTKPTYFLAGENGPEMVIDSGAYRRLSPDTRDMLTRELRGIKGFEQGLYNKDVTGGSRFEVPASNGGQSNEQLLTMVLQAMERYTTVMERLEQSGIVAYISRDPKEIKELLRQMDKFTASKAKAKV